MSTKKAHLGIEQLESRTLFAGAHEALVENSVETVECEGFIRQMGEVLISAGSYMEMPGNGIQSVGEGIRDFFAEIPEYPSNGVYTGLSVDVLAGTGSFVSALGLIPTVAGTCIGAVGAIGEMLGDDGEGYDSSFSNMIHDLGDGIQSVGEGISEWGMHFHDAQRYAPKYGEFVAQHEEKPATIAGTFLGSTIMGLGFITSLPGLAVHKTGDLTVKTCDVAHAVSTTAQSAWASVSDTYQYYFGAEAADTAIV